MKQRGRRLWLTILFGITILAGGCTLFGWPSAEATRQRVDDAAEHLEIIRRLDVPPELGDEVDQAGILLGQARDHLEAGRRSRAVEAAEESLSISQGILKAFYLDNIARMARTLRDELQTRTTEDPEHPLKSELPRVEGIIDRADRIAGDRQVISLRQVLDDLEGILQISYAIQTTLTETLESDISFAKGRYRLSSQGEKSIDRLIETVRRDRASFRERFSGGSIVTHVKVVGYTDSLNFGRGTRLERELTEGVGDRLPPADPERRKFLNHRLSTFRAQTIADFIKDRLTGGEGESPMTVRTETVGRGESIPADVPAPYPVMDARRRICRIYVHTTIE